MNTNQAQLMVPNDSASFSLGDPVPLEQAGSGREIAERVRQGKAFLQIVSTPWGVEFYVCEVVSRP
ncbi:MAG: hypothetical protein KGI38_01220 [Thaumarchaeota archaeon]|nr:hypothetical protein [Nitrososphaerota archaeon]